MDVIRNLEVLKEVFEHSGPLHDAHATLSACSLQTSSIICSHRTYRYLSNCESAFPESDFSDALSRRGRKTLRRHIRKY